MKQVLYIVTSLLITTSCTAQDSLKSVFSGRNNPSLNVFGNGTLSAAAMIE